jgi:hypothetical protein
MTKPNRTDANRRFIPLDGHDLAGVPVRYDDIELTRGLYWVAMLFRVMAGLLLLLIVVQVINGLSSAVEISYGVLIAEAVRLIIFAGLLWGAGDLADLFVKSHYDLRATRILLGRLTHLAGQIPGSGEPRPGDSDSDLGHGDARH